MQRKQNGMISCEEFERFGLDLDRPDAQPEWFYIVRFNLSQLWYGYTGTSGDTLQIEIPERWLQAAT